jgi:hypothetical protein
MERFKCEFVEIMRDKLSDLDPVYVEEMEKLRGPYCWRRRAAPVKR